MIGLGRYLKTTSLHDTKIATILTALIAIGHASLIAKTPSKVPIARGRKHGANDVSA
jgi:hypothetical protein